MRRGLLYCALCVALCGCAATQQDKSIKPSEAGESPAAASGIPHSYKDIVFPKYNYEPPFPGDFRIAVTDSITLYAVRDTTLPLIDITIYFKDYQLPKNKKELAEMKFLSSLYARGGTQKLTANKMDDSLEFLSAGISGNISFTQSFVHLNCLSKDLHKVLPLLRDLFNEPRLDSARLAVQKSSALQNWLHRYDQPRAQLSALSHKVLYKDNFKLWDIDSSIITSVKRESLVKEYKRFFVPRRVFIAAAGDFHTDSIVQVVKNLFADWKPADSAHIKEHPKLEFKGEKGIFVSEKDISQANILIAREFVKRPHADYYPTAVANYILGGGSFSSRLSSRVRAKEGLAYSIYSFAESDYEDAGVAGISLQTKAESAQYALELIEEECKRLAQEGPTAEELEFAKTAIIESIPGMFKTSEETANAFATSEFLGRSLNHYKEFPEKIKAVSAEQVKAMVAKYFDITTMSVSIVGSKDKMKLKNSFKEIPLDSLDF